MGSITSVLLVGSVLLLLGIASSTFALRMGMPVLVLFLVVGMLAGSEGLGGIPFEDYRLAHALGSAALALILFDGGLRTTLDTIRAVWRPALALSTIGVILTAGLAGIAATWVLNIPLLHAMLLGGIISSTDAAAVFSVLRTSRLKLPERIASTLEIESGSNDPMAIFLTVGLIEVIAGNTGSGAELVSLFLLQFGIGTITGLLVGRGTAWIVERVDLGTAGLYPIFATACGLLAFGLAGELGGSGFLAAYLTGIVLGNSDLVFKRGILIFPTPRRGSARSCSSSCWDFSASRVDSSRWPRKVC